MPFRHAVLPLRQRQAYLEIEGECLRRLRLRAQTEEAKLSDVVRDMDEIEGLDMNNLVSIRIEATAHQQAIPYAAAAVIIVVLTAHCTRE